ncbi:FUSC family protein [Pedobacter miscanthi]|uniref:FUSC family protein n=1 Tax=Pedobacter miscanthi TaxID=2259170 RepID=A0A366KSL6_9SPHI|nr:FUSC family protein [Pedobacter miscanthi]RBQ04263.1 FUSC family protein [Pedobacter miscanthi]
MIQKELAQLTDQELLQEAKKVKSDKIITAALIGFLAGVIVYSVVKKSFGFLTLIPIVFIYKLINKPKYNTKELEEVLKERGLR